MGRQGDHREVSAESITRSASASTAPFITSAPTRPGELNFDHPASAVATLASCAELYGALTPIQMVARSVAGDTTRSLLDLSAGA